MNSIDVKSDRDQPQLPRENSVEKEMTLAELTQTKKTIDSKKSTKTKDSKKEKKDTNQKQSNVSAPEVAQTGQDSINQDL